MRTAGETREKAPLLVEAAFKLYLGGEHAQALDLLHKALEVDPSYVPALVLQGLTYQEKGKPEEAEKAYRHALMHEPDSREAHQSLGLHLVASGHLAEGLVHLLRHHELDPANATTLDVLIPSLVQAGRPGEAARVLVDTWNRTREPEAAVRYARFLLSRGEVTRARDFLTEVVQKMPSPHLLVELALALVIAEEYEEAVPVLEQAISLRKDYDRAWRGLAHCYTQLDEGERAIECVERALTINPRHYRNWQAKGDALLILQRYSEVLETARKGIELIAPDDAEAAPVLAVLFLQEFSARLQLNNLDEALAGLEEGRQRLPSEKRFYLYPVDVLTQLGRLHDALQLLDQAYAAGLSNAFEIVSLRYRILHQLGRDGEAMATIEPLLEKHGEGLAGALADQALELYLLGEPGTSLAIFQQLNSLYPDQVRYLNAVSFLTIGTGNLDEAETWLCKALAVCDRQNRGVTLNNLGYLALLEGRLADAERPLAEALEEPDISAFLRVMYWQQERLVADYAAFPTRSIMSHLAAKANLASLELARGDVGKALRYGEEIVSSEPDRSLGYEVLGCVHMAQNEMAAARASWAKGLQLAEEPAHRQMIQSWLNQAQPA